MLSLTIVVLLTSELSLIDDKDDAMVCLYTVLSYTTLRDTTWTKLHGGLLLWSNLKQSDKRYLALIAKFHFIRLDHLQRIDGVKTRMHLAILQNLTNAGLIKRFKLDDERRVALSEAGLRAVCRRDRLSVRNALTTRSPELEENGEFKGSEMRNAFHNLKHDDSANDFIALFAEHARAENISFDFEVARHLHRGYEDRQKKKRQIAPDLQVMLFGSGYYYIEVEMRAHTPRQPTDKIMPYIHYFRSRQWRPDLRVEPTVLFVCKDSATAYKFLTIAYNIFMREKVSFALGVTDIETVRAQSPVSKAVWLTRTSLMSGQTYPLSSTLHF